jgi:hypothetical protein
MTKVQIGRESTSGTPVASTSIWRGEFSMLEDTRERTVVEEQTGSFVTSDRSYDGKLEAAWAQPSTPLTYEQVAHIFEAGIKTATPSGTGPYVRAYNYPYGGTSVNTIKTYTIESGSTVVAEDVYEMEYSFVESFELSGSFGEAWTMSSNWIGRQMTQTSFTGALTVPTVYEALFPHTKLYIDASGGTIGSTQIVGALMSASINVTTGLKIVPVGDGQLYFAAHKWTKPEITFSITLELEDSSIVADQRDVFRVDGIQLFRLAVTDGTRILNLDWAGKYDPPGDYANSEGNTTVTFTGRGVASATDSLSFTATLTNGVAAYGSGGH